jgi:hypothetical protein
MGRTRRAFRMSMLEPLDKLLTRRWPDSNLSARARVMYHACRLTSMQNCSFSLRSISEPRQTYTHTLDLLKIIGFHIAGLQRRFRAVLPSLRPHEQLPL